jgi:hypothetical protein
MSEEKLKAKQKLQWLGLSEAAQSLSEIQAELDLLKSNLPDYETFQDHLENGYDIDNDGDKESINDFASFNSYLQELGFSSEEANSFIEKIKQNFTDEDSSGSVFDEFKSYALDESQSFSALETGFGSSTQITGTSETEQGVAASGIKFHESGGVTRAGVSVPAGSTEIYGREIHFSQSAPPSDEDTGSGGGISYSNISSDPIAPLIGEAVEISADVTNNYSTEASLAVDFKEDGVTINDKSVTIGAGSTNTISFVISKNEYVTRDYSIGGSDTVSVTWIPQQAGPYP